jgi:hypothetical protein
LYQTKRDNDSRVLQQTYEVRSINIDSIGNDNDWIKKLKTKTDLRAEYFTPQIEKVSLTKYSNPLTYIFPAEINIDTFIKFLDDTTNFESGKPIFGKANLVFKVYNHDDMIIMKVWIDTKSKTIDVLPKLYRSSNSKLSKNGLLSLEGLIK